MSRQAPRSQSTKPTTTGSTGEPSQKRQKKQEKQEEQEEQEKQEKQEEQEEQEEQEKPEKPEAPAEEEEIWEHFPKVCPSRHTQKAKATHTCTHTSALHLAPPTTPKPPSLCVLCVSV